MDQSESSIALPLVLAGDIRLADAATALDRRHAREAAEDLGGVESSGVTAPDALIAVGALADDLGGKGADSGAAVCR